MNVEKDSKDVGKVKCRKRRISREFNELEDKEAVEGKYV